MTVSVGCALFNYESGGLRQDGYDFKPLQAALADSPRVPALIKLCEGKHYADRGGQGLLLAAKALSEEFRVPYVGLLGHMERGPMPPAIFYDPNVLTLLPPWYGNGSQNDFHDQRNIAHFLVNGTDIEFLAGVDHWEPLYGPVRELAARRWGRYGRKAKKRVIFSGDLNCTPSGPHFPQRDWKLAAEVDWTNATHKGRQKDGVWVADTAPMDYLIGEWVEVGRVGGAGFTLLAELAWQACADQPAERRPRLLTPDGRILPTVNTHVDAGGGLHIDAVLANDLMLDHFDPSTLEIHVPSPGVRHSDHRLITWELQF
jgi:hypothetical protein